MRTTQELIVGLKHEAADEMRHGDTGRAQLLAESATRLEAGEALAGAAAAAEVQLTRYCSSTAAFGYAQLKQLRAALAACPVKRTATVQCFRCLKFFPLPDMTQDEPYPIQCTHCGYAHTVNDATAAQWPGA
jgi:DNA-directed RNA polymerase subunit RPC12/RpoP